KNQQVSNHTTYNGMEEEVKAFLINEEQLHTFDDLTKVNPVTTATVLKCLQARYATSLFYTHAGCTLVALNPFQPVPNLYSFNIMRDYHTASRPQDLQPHIYIVAELAFRNVQGQVEPINQSLIVSGESGAGKTWTSRCLMNYFATVAASSTSAKCQEHVERIEKRVLDSNPVMEAFGNACTLRNHNSSRFGKYIQLQLNRSQQLEGASVHTYLLEKTRVAYQAPSERNFHIFYQILVGLLNLGNVGFSSPADESQPCELKEDTKGFLKTTAKLLRVCEEDLGEQLRVRTITAGRQQQVFKKPCSRTECGTRRDCLAKVVYAKLFDWLVKVINTSICSDPSTWTNFIGLLDVYGFESFPQNNLEQLCINYANEKLQQHFVAHYLKAQQEDYTAEGLDWSFVRYQDNQSCLDLIEGSPASVFSLLNEECRLNRLSDADQFKGRLQKALGANNCMSWDVFSKVPHFTVAHYAGRVSYQIEGMTEKNKDPVPPELVQLLQKSQDALLKQLFPVAEQDLCDAKALSKAISVVAKFKGSLESLMRILNSTTPRYIRCIKPNGDCKPHLFRSQEVLTQLEACGIVETIHISAAGFPVRCLEQLECARSQMLSHKATFIQSSWRHYRRRKLARLRRATTVLQAAVRSWLTRRWIKKCHYAATVVQQAWKSWKVRMETLAAAELDDTSNFEEEMAWLPGSPVCSQNLSSSKPSQSTLKQDLKLRSWPLGLILSSAPLTALTFTVSGTVRALARSACLKVQWGRINHKQEPNQSGCDLVSIRALPQVKIKFRCKRSPLHYADICPESYKCTINGLNQILLEKTSDHNLINLG
uniref:Myosin XIX n=1 Tax=Callorhinchus milii TaxID=7868 RepID=A0A4W3JJN4_CALMI